MDLQTEYEKLFPMTNWSDEEILDYIEEQCSQSNGILNIKVDISLEDYMKQTGAVFIDDIINEIQGMRGPIGGE